MKYAYTLFMLCVCARLFAQAPANDHVAHFINIGKAPVASINVYHTVGATASDVAPGAETVCTRRESSLNDVWFGFSAPSDLPDLRVTITPTPDRGLVQPQIALYRYEGSFDRLKLVSCGTNVQRNAVLEASSLAPAVLYLLRVWDDAASEARSGGYFLIGVAQAQGGVAAPAPERNIIPTIVADTVPVVSGGGETSAEPVSDKSANTRLTAKGVEETDESASASSVGLSISGGLSGRSLHFKPVVKNQSSATGVISVDVCVDAYGAVVKAKPTLRGSTTANSDLRALAEKKALEFRFAPANVLEECGTIRFNFQR